MNTVAIKTIKGESKVERVKAELLRQIKLNNFPRGSMLPSERELPDRLGASYMTVRKAIGELVAEDYLERRHGIGTFVRKDVSRNKLNGVVGIICPAWESPDVADFIIHASSVAEVNGWCPKLFFCRFWEDRVIEDAWKNCDALFILPPGPMNMISASQMKLFSSFEKPVVIIGVAAHMLGMDAVMGTPGQAMRIALDHLEQQGHRRIAYFSQDANDSGRDILPYQSNYACWHELVSRKCDKVDDLLFRVKVEPYVLAHETLYSQLMKQGKEGIGFSAFVGDYSLVWGVVAALHDLGIKIPDNVSAVVIGDRQEAKFYRPKITSVCYSLREHAEKALKIVEQRLQCPDAPAQCLLVEPRWENGETLKTMTP